MNNSIKKSHTITNNILEGLCQKMEKGFKENQRSIEHVIESVDCLRAVIIKKTYLKKIVVEQMF